MSAQVELGKEVRCKATNHEREELGAESTDKSVVTDSGSKALRFLQNGTCRSHSRKVLIRLFQYLEGLWGHEVYYTVTAGEAI